MTTTRRRFIAIALGAPAAMALAGCTHRYLNHGYVPTDEELAQIVVGKTSREEVESILGRPGAQGMLTGTGWYYVGSRWEYYGARPPREIRREVVAVSFAESGMVSNVERFGLERGRVIPLSSRVTEMGTNSKSALGQILRNIGNFNPGKMF